MLTTAANRPVRQLVIVGGGTAGWMTAAALARLLPRDSYRICLVESEAIGTVGVGEATVPHLRFFNQLLGLDEQEFMRATQATYKLGIELCDWGKLGDSYINPFSVYGQSREGIAFHHYWLRAQAEGCPFALGEFSPGVVAAYAQKFAYPARDPQAPMAKYSYAFHLDASLYANCLRDYSEARGVVRVEGKINAIACAPDTGEITQLQLDSGEQLAGDFFIDCSGFSSLLLGKTLNVGYEDWSQWLICDSAVAVPSRYSGEALPYTRAIARTAGWQWQIPLQQRAGNGYVFSSRHLDAADAQAFLLKNLPGEPLAQPRLLKFCSGRRVKSWHKNTVAIGLASGFLEPLESTSIYLIQAAIMKLVEVFPRFVDEPLLADEYNRDLAMEYERVRDFLILHYHATQRADSEFWNYCRTMDIPASLQQKIDLFLTQGEVESYSRGMFLEPSWVALYLGQGLQPKAFHPGARQLSSAQLQQWLAAYRLYLRQQVQAMPGHAQALQNLAASNQPWPRAAMSLYSVFS